MPQDAYAAPQRHVRTPSASGSLVPLVSLEQVELGRIAPAQPWVEPMPAPLGWRYRLKMGICALLVMGVPIAIVYLSVRAMKQASR